MCSLASSCPALFELNKLFWVYKIISSLCSLFFPAVCTVTEDQTYTVSGAHLPHFCFLKVFFLPVCVSCGMEVAARYPVPASCYSALEFGGIADSSLSATADSSQEQAPVDPVPQFRAGVPFPGPVEPVPKSRPGVLFHVPWRHGLKFCHAHKSSFNPFCLVGHVHGDSSSCCGLLHLLRKWKRLLRDPVSAPDFTSCPELTSASELSPRKTTCSCGLSCSCV